MRLNSDEVYFVEIFSRAAFIVSERSDVEN